MRTLGRSTVHVRRFLDVVLIALILVVVSGVILAKVVPLTGRQTFIVGGGSMEPAIGTGSAIIVAPVAASDLHVGDIVSLRAGDDRALFTHRIVEVLEQPDGVWVRTKGDANAQPDPTPVRASDIEGRVQLAIPFAGFVIATMSIPAGVLFLIGLAATLLAAVWLLESFELDRMDRDRLSRSTDPVAGAGEFADDHPVTGPRLPVDGGHGHVRPGIAERIALARSTRNRRNRWRAAHERADGPAD